jgi:uncharacterized BrkB/YihY/UPF0761 family membrane protein
MDKIKRIAAIIGVILIGSMYLITLISAFFATEKAPGLFLASAFCTVVIPLMIYAFVAVYRWVHRNDDPKPEDKASNGTKK